MGHVDVCVCVYIYEHDPPPSPTHPPTPKKPVEKHRRNLIDMRND